MDRPTGLDRSIMGSRLARVRHFVTSAELGFLVCEHALSTKLEVVGGGYRPLRTSTFDLNLQDQVYKSSLKN